MRFTIEGCILFPLLLVMFLEIVIATTLGRLAAGVYMEHVICHINAAVDAP